MKPVVILDLRGVRCDATGCGYADYGADISKPEEWLNRPCPTCGAALLADEDYRSILHLRAAVDLTNAEFPLVDDGEKRERIPLAMDGSGRVVFPEDIGGAR